MLKEALSVTVLVLGRVGAAFGFSLVLPLPHSPLPPLKKEEVSTLHFVFVWWV